MLFFLINEKNVLSCFILCMCVFNLYVYMKIVGIFIMVLIDRNMFVYVKMYYLWENSKKKKKYIFLFFFCFVYKLCVINLYMEFEF